VHDEPVEEEIPLKRKKISFVDKGKQVPTQIHVPPHGAPSGGDGLFQLPPGGKFRFSGLFVFERP